MGLAISQGQGNAPLRAAHPYLAWSDGATSVSALGGIGRSAGRDTWDRDPWGRNTHATHGGLTAFDARPLRLGRVEAQRRVAAPWSWPVRWAPRTAPGASTSRAACSPPTAGAAHRERGLAATLGRGRAGAPGPSLSLSGRWGDAATGGDTLWQEQLHYRHGSLANNAWSLDARAGLGWRLPGGALLHAGAGLSHTGDAPRALLELRLAPAAVPAPPANAEQD